MAGLDAKFLYSETPTAHMHTLKVALLPPGVDYEAFSGELCRQVAHLTPLRRRIVPVPGNLGHPVWVEDPDLDLAHHVRRVEVAAPGGTRELAAVVAALAGQPLDRHRPLWEVVFVEGLADGPAVVAKLHHALADGAAAVALLDLATRIPDGGSPPAAEPLPGRRQLLAVAARAHARRLRTLPHLIKSTWVGFVRFQRLRRSLAVRPALPLQAPRTSLNVSLVAERTFAMTTLPLDELKRIGRATGTTLNDVYLAVCAGALRRYLADRGELPGRPLVASVPLSTDTDRNHLIGNRVDNLYVALATDVADPLARLQRIHEEAQAAKTARGAFGNELFEQRADVVPPQLYTRSIRLWTRSGLADHTRPPLNLIVSNVAGPRRRLRFAGVELRGLYSVGPILEGIGLNITAWSYVDRLHVSVLGCPASLPDPWAITAQLEAALTELSATCPPAAPAPSATSP